MSRMSLGVGVRLDFSRLISSTARPSCLRLTRVPRRKSGDNLAAMLFGHRRPVLRERNHRVDVKKTVAEVMAHCNRRNRHLASPRRVEETDTDTRLTASFPLQFG